MDREQFDDIGPEPGRSIERRAGGLGELGAPGAPGCGLHLPSMGDPHDRGQIRGDLGRLLGLHAADLEFQVLGHQLAQHDAATEQPGGDHALAKMR